MQSTSTQGLSFRLGDLPPRHLPASLSFAVILTMTVPTAFAIGFGGFFFAITHRHADPLALLGPGDGAGPSTATIDSIQHQKNKGRHSGDYVFMSAVVDGRSVPIVRYIHGESAHNLSGAVELRIDPAHPSRAHVPGMQVGEVPAVFALGFPFVLALISFVWTFVRARRRLWLLQHGRLTSARRVDYTVRRGSKNKQTHIVTFEYEVDGVTREHIVKTSRHPAGLLDQDEEPLLYDPDRPTRAFAIDELSIEPRHDETGTVGATKMQPFVLSAIGWCIAVAVLIAGFAYPILENTR